MLPYNFYTGELPTTEGILFNGNSNNDQIMTNIVLVNTSGTSKTATILVDPTGTNTTKYTILSALPLAAGETVSIDIRQVFADDIRGVASGTGVHCFISGVRQVNSS